MSRAILSVVIGLLIGNLARAEVVVELVPDNPGPYRGGETLTVDVWLHSEVDYWASFSFVQFDFAATDARLLLDQTFTFDYSSLANPHGYVFGTHELPLPWTYNGWAIACEPACPGDFFAIAPGGGPFHVGSIGVQLPETTGHYGLDLLNALEPDPELGASLGVAFSPFYPDPNWYAHTGEITGGTHDFSVVVVPAVSEWGIVCMGLLLLTAGSVILKRGSRSLPRLAPSGQSWMSRGTVSRVLLVIGSALSIPARQSYAEPVELPSDIVNVNLDSGDVSATGGGSDPIVVFSDTVTVTDAIWVRLHFDQAQLSGTPGGTDESFVRVTSQADGAVQVLRSATLNAWSMTTAYFSGDAVLLELLAYPNTGTNRVVVDTASVGWAGEGIERSAPCGGICGGEDDRVVSSDPRSGRLRYRKTWGCMLSACTAFLFDNRPNVLLTAGHCCSRLDFTCDFTPVVEFAVDDWSLFDPPNPRDQYPLDPNAVHHPGGEPADFCYVGVFNNNDAGDPEDPSEGRNPLQRQGASYRLAGSVPNRDGGTLNVTGYGKSPPTGQPPHTQYTSQGPQVSRVPGDADWIVRSAVDAIAGNSGSAVEHECGLTFGIQTQVYCTCSGSNVGTRVDWPAVRDWLTPLLIDGGGPQPTGVAADCNNNGRPDWCDVGHVYPYGTCGTCETCETCPDPCPILPDCNGNLVPDECEPQVGGTGDCNGNELQDICEIASGAVPDCNFNSVPDECDITSGFSEDANENDIPDQCEPTTDCNGNGREDVCDVAAGLVADCNENFIPDECDEDCDENGNPDECDIATWPVRDCYNSNGVLDECELFVPTGRCCKLSGMMRCFDDVTECWCDWRNGTYGGDGSTCAPHGCLIYGPQPGP